MMQANRAVKGPLLRIIPDLNLRKHQLTLDITFKRMVSFLRTTETVAVLRIRKESLFLKLATEGRSL
jgi:hypothetical protein